MKRDLGKLLFIVCAMVLVAGPFTASSSAQENLPEDRIGAIGVPEGQIAFIRGKDVWIMNADGTDQMMIQEAGNADGRLCWSPDNKRVIFTRSGKVDFKGPDWLGGFHKVYDLFIASIDSARNGNTNWFRRVTDDVGSRDPQWTKDEKLLYYKDMNGNRVNTTEPNYQICMADTNGLNIEILRKDWAMMGDRFLISPAINSAGDIACVYFSELRPLGLVVLPRDDFMKSMDSLQLQAREHTQCVGPAWSPDGKWLAYVKNDINDPGLYIATPDLKEKFLVFEPPVGTYLYTVSPSFSPNSKWLTFSTTDGSIWICDIGGNNAKRISGPGMDKWPAWSN